MKLLRACLALLALAAVAGLAYVAQQGESSGARMVAAAKNFLGTLNDDQGKKATFDYDSKERTNWNFIPLQDAQRKSTRKGLPLEEMKADQKKAALELVRAGTSQAGHEAATAIMSLEAILNEQEKGKAMVRDPEWYFFTVFGTPSTKDKWGWRVEGHHLSINFTMNGAQVVAATPTFFGANPAEVRGGPKKGLRILAPAEDLARQLFKALDDDQKKIAYSDKSFPEPGQNTLTPKVGAPAGLAAAKMTADQKDILTKLLKSYANRWAPDVAELEMKGVMDAGIDKVHFAYNGGTELGEKRTYRVHGPTFLIEFLNEQADSAGNAANHIHSNWRRLKGDFGIP